MKKQIRTRKNTIRKSIWAIPAILILTLCQGCADKALPEVHALSVDSDGVTGAGIGIGSTYEEWAEAYSPYEIQIADGDDFVPANIEAPDAAADKADADTDATAGQTDGDEAAEDTVTADGTASSHDGRYMAAAFYIDDEPVSVDELGRSEGCTGEELADRLSSAEYLADHTVVFRYVIFTITDGVVSDIEADYLDYNGEL